MSGSGRHDDPGGLPNRTLLWGGALLCVTALSSLASSALYPSLSWEVRIIYLPTAAIPTTLLAALLIFALGVRGDSVMGRSIVGKVALIGFGITNAYFGWFGFLEIPLTHVLAYGLTVAPVLGPPLLIIAVVVIAWRGTLPGLWRVVPLLTVAALVARFWHSLTVHVDPFPQLSLDASVAIAQVLLGSVAVGLSFRCPVLTERMLRHRE